MKVLIVDDNKQNINLLKDFIESWGYETLLATQGIEALEIAKAIIPDIILLDVMLPGFSGYEVCHSIKADPNLNTIPIILLTALTDEADRIHGYKVGADGFLSKPIAYKELRAMVEHFLRQKKVLENAEMPKDVAKIIESLLKERLGENDKSYDKCFYYKKIINLMELKNGSIEKLEIAGRIYSKKWMENSNWDFNDLKYLKMGSWLVPLFNCLKDYKNLAKHKDLELIDGINFKIEADILILVDEICILIEEGMEKKAIIKKIRADTLEEGYNTLIIDKIEEIFKTEQMLDLLSNNC